MRLSYEEVLGAWTMHSSLRKGSVKSPGLPVAPHPIKPRAPRQPGAFDPVEQRKKSSPPFQFSPHNKGDLYQLHLQDNYETVKQKSPRKRTATPKTRNPFRRLSSTIRAVLPKVSLPTYTETQQHSNVDQV